MQIPIDLIAPSPHPIRSSWDEDKMTELAQSVREQGVIVPIKVRPTDNEHYEIVYGHRRVEAARRAGLKEIPAVVEGVDDTDALIQALIENVQREDMNPMDLARALKGLQELTGWSQGELERRGIIKQVRASRILALLDVPERLQPLITSAPGGDVSPGTVTEGHVRAAREGSAGQHTVFVRSIEKAIDEGLTSQETGRLASVIAAAQDDAEREAILDTDYHDPAFQRLVRVKSEVKRETARRERKQREENPREVAEYIKALQDFTGKVTIAVKVAEYGKFSPEAVTFVNGWHDSLRRRLAELEQAMEDYNAKVQE